MSLLIPGSGESAKILVGDRILTKSNELITPVKNYLSRYFDASQLTGTLLTLAPTGTLTSFTAWHTDAGGSATTEMRTSDAALRGTMLYRSGLLLTSTSGGVFFQTPVFLLDQVDAGKPVYVSFDISSSIADDDYDVVVVRYNSALVYQELLPISGNVSTITGTPSAKLPTGKTTFRGFFVSNGSDTTARYALRFRRRNGTQQINFDTLYVGPQAQLTGAPVTDWQSYTPTISNMGTVTQVNGLWRRVGDTIEGFVRFTMGTPSGSPASVGLPSGLTTDVTKVDSLTNTPIGLWQRSQAGATTTKRGVVLQSGVAATVVYFGIDEDRTAQSPYTLQNGNALAVSGETVSLNFRVPISQWASNVTMADRAVEEYASNSSTTDADDTTSFAYGIDGSVVPSISGATNRNKRSRFQTPIQPTDSIVIEVKPGSSGEWSSSLAQDGANIGITWTKANTTDVDVTFGFSGNSANNAFGTATWATRAASGWRWRVRKVSGGSVVGFPVGARNVVGDTSGTTVPTGYIANTLAASPGANVTPAASGSFVAITSLTVPAGPHVIVGMAEFLPGTLSGLSYFLLSIGTSATSVTNAEASRTQPREGTGQYGPGMLYVNNAAATVYYLISRIDYSSLGTAVYGTASTLRATRIG